MTKALRGFKCDMTGEPCDDGRCTRGNCMQARELQVLLAQAPPSINERNSRKYAERLARGLLLSAKGISNPSGFQIEKIIRDLRLIDYAKKEAKKRKQDKISN